ncbi:MAG: hypothetical protein ACK4U0_04550 [Mesorhizobium sp.]
MEGLFKDLSGSTIALFVEIGGIVFVPIALVALFVGMLISTRISVLVKTAVLAVSAILYFSWSSLFVFPYEYSPGNFQYHISGWRLTPPAEAFLQNDPALAVMSREKISAELMKSFKAPEYVWLGADLNVARWLGSALMAVVLFSVGLILGSLRLSKG